MSKFGKAVLFSAAVTIGGMIAGAANAQSDEDTARDVPGRYVVVETDNGPVMLDSAFGRTWIMVKDGDGFVWRRVFLESQSDVPAGMVRRPPKLKN
ncbi:MAG: hypothetical protein R8L07_12245 [Alphaproteobacteria bacterium]|nr:hypothetical protein [Alphaproteobacteria bacterium]